MRVSAVTLTSTFKRAAWVGYAAGLPCVFCVRILLYLVCIECSLGRSPFWKNSVWPWWLYSKFCFGDLLDGVPDALNGKFNCYFGSCVFLFVGW